MFKKNPIKQSESIPKLKQFQVSVVPIAYKVIIEKSRGEVSPMGQDTIENVS